MASPIFPAIADVASIHPDRINWFFSLSILFTYAVMYGGSADVIVTVVLEVEQVRQHVVETIILLLWISGEVFICNVDRRRHTG